ncbi:MAG: SRPBCC domain-containing protein [Bacteroidetes bacterium]|nr:SRPBCC domain-containing protein [Bacteroidota bacterium]
MPSSNPHSSAYTERIISATPAQVFNAFRQPELLATWWGPDGFTNTFEKFEFKPGGEWVFVMHGPDGTNYQNASKFIEIVPEKLVILEHVVKPWFRLTVTFAASGENTLLTWNQEFDSPETINPMRSFIETANEQNLNRLEKLVLGF